ncbi:hypothetical protein JRI60_28240 [Archangium violaceum]|uniref:hypothetical protein n=1 Tax=Archangium violaceum TaxID=83451 RepID=UPI00194F1F39|nr:hypothetical protein [Archangium violaceum]QRN93094.1 hypothetical protein JRI60_28240 [Archangium violaceum]
MSLESLDSRVLGAVRFLDGETAQPLTTPLTVSGDGMRVVRNRSGLYVITEAPGLEDYTARFEAPPMPGPAPSTFTLSVVDPSGRHLPRSFSLELPRGAPEAVFAPVDVRMYLAPTARPSPGSAVVRLSLRDEQDAPLARRVIRLRVDLLDRPAVEGLGLSDERGETLLLVPRIPIIRWGHEQGESLSHRIFSATLESALAPSVEGLPDPDVPDQSFTPLPQTLQVASGLETNRRIPIPTS